MIYINRENTVSATVDTETQLSTNGSEATPGTLYVPANCRKIKQLIVGVGDSVNSGADGNTNYLVRLSGSGLIEGDMVFTVGSAFQVFTAAGTTGFGIVSAQVFDVDIDVNPNQIINVFAQQTGGVTVGAPEVSVTMAFA